jgi:hypothetical protein
VQALCLALEITVAEIITETQPNKSDNEAVWLI